MGDNDNFQLFNDDNDIDNDNNNYNYDYLIEERNNRIKQKKLFNNNNNNDNNSKSFNYSNINRFNKYNNFRSLDINKIEENNNNNNNFYLGKKDKDIEEFNLLNQNLVNTSKKVVVTPLLYNENKNNYNKNYDNNLNYNGEYNKNSNYTIGNDYSRTRKENLYSLIRKNNDRLENIKEMEEKC